MPGGPAAFTISLRTGWDPQGMDEGKILAERSDLPSSLESMDRLARILELPGT